MSLYLRFQLLLKPQDRLVCLHIDVKSAENGVFLGIDVRDQLQGLHLDGDSNPIAEGGVNVLGVQVMTSVAADLLKVEIEVRLQFLHIELEVAHLR